MPHASYRWIFKLHIIFYEIPEFFFDFLILKREKNAIKLSLTYSRNTSIRSKNHISLVNKQNAIRSSLLYYIFYGHLHLHLTSAEEKIIYRYIIQFYLITRTSEILKISGITAHSYGRFQPYLFITLYQKAIHLTTLT